MLSVGDKSGDLGPNYNQAAAVSIILLCYIISICLLYIILCVYNFSRSVFRSCAMNENIRERWTRCYIVITYTVQLPVLRSYYDRDSVYSFIAARALI